MKTNIVGTIIILLITSILGLSLIMIPFTSGEDALYTPDDKFISMVAKLDSTYSQDVENNLLGLSLRAKRNAEYNAFKAEIDTIKSNLSHQRDSLLNRRKVDQANALSDSIIGYDPILTEKYNELDMKWSASSMDKAEINNMIANIKDTLSMEKYFEQLVSDRLDKKYAYSEFVVKSINKQDSLPFVFSGLALFLIGLIYILYDNKTIALNQVGLYATVSILFAGAVAFMTREVADGIEKPVIFMEVSEKRDDVVKERLGLIRDAQKAYKSANKKGVYAKNFHELKSWLKQGEIEILTNISDDPENPVYDTTRVEAFSHVFPVEKYGEVIVDSLSVVPFSNGHEFEMYTSVISKGRTKVPVLQVGTKKINYLEDVALDNFDKKSEIKIGSLQEPTLNGNWGE